MRHSGHTGITGLAQIHGYRGDTCIETRVAYDLEYFKGWSLALDLHIILRTVGGIFRPAQSK
jgi:lipopolysaccharide/colanic/teichoic acid biosynthesis glycosyltransferase